MGYSALNWNTIHDPLDKTIWDRLTANFWLPEKVPVANDLSSWRKMTPAEKNVVEKVFAELTLLDTIQSQEGVISLIPYAQTGHEEAVYTNIMFMESVHAKSYSTIFSTLCSTEKIDQLFHWAETDEKLQLIAGLILSWYHEATPSGKFVASVFLESFLFYTGFYAPLRFASEGKITNTADLIRLILRDEGVHGFYIGYKFQQLREFYPISDMEIRDFLKRLFDIEMRRVEELYDPLGWTEDVKMFLRYNANKALANLGLEPMFPAEDVHVSATILAALDPGTGESHDFFSGSGASYVIGTAEETDDTDWEW